MEHKSTCTLQSSINNSNVALSSTISVHNRLENNVVGVVFGYPWCEGGGSVDLEYVLPNDSMNAFGNNQKFLTVLL